MAMLSKKQRLTVAEFDRYFKSGRRRHGLYLQLIVSACDEFHGAVVVGKKVHKTAVARNRLRRQLYAALYAAHQAKTVTTGVYIVLVKPAAKTVSVDSIRAELRQLLAESVSKG